MTDSVASQIAMDLASVIVSGTLRENEELPSQAELMQAYGVAMGTAAAALAKVRDAGLIETSPGRRARVLRRWSWQGDVATLFLAGHLCRSEAAISHGDGPPTAVVAWCYDREWDQQVPVRKIDTETLTHLDRTVIRALGEQLHRAALRIVGLGSADGDDRLVAAAEALLRDGGRRPQDQAGIALSPGWPSDKDNPARRLWPERYAESDDPSPF